MRHFVIYFLSFSGVLFLLLTCLFMALRGPSKFSAILKERIIIYLFFAALFYVIYICFGIKILACMGLTLIIGEEVYTKLKKP